MAKWSRKRQNKDGTFSYTFRVYRGYTPEGERLKPYVYTWKSPAGLTERQADKEAQRQAVLYEEQCKSGLVCTQQNLTLAGFIPQYLETMEETHSPATCEFYRSVIRRCILPALGNHKLSQIKPVHVQAFVSQLNSMESQTPHANKPISPNTVKRYLCVLQSIFRQAVKLGILPENPASAEKLTLKKPVKPEIDIFTKQEAAAMLEALEQEPLQFQVLIQLAVITGARRGELVALRFEDIDQTANKVTIARAAVKIVGKTAQTKAPKDYEVRSIAVSPYCIDLVNQLEQEKRRERLRLGSQWHEGGWLFTQWNGEMMNPCTPTRQFSKFLERNGFRHRKFHALRHTSATLLLYGGVSLKQVQGRLGHGDIETTNKYLHCLQEADEEAACVLQSMLTVSRNPKPEQAQTQTEPRQTKAGA